MKADTECTGGLETALPFTGAPEALRTLCEKDSTPCRCEARQLQAEGASGSGYLHPAGATHTQRDSGQLPLSFLPTTGALGLKSLHFILTDFF